MAVDLFELKAYTEDIGIDDLRLVHITEAGGGPGWGLMRRDGAGLDRWLALEAGSKDDAVRVIEAVGLMPLGEEPPVSGEQDVVLVLQPGSGARTRHDPGLNRRPARRRPVPRGPDPSARCGIRATWLDGRMAGRSSSSEDGRRRSPPGRRAEREVRTRWPCCPIPNRHADTSSLCRSTTT